MFKFFKKTFVGLAKTRHNVSNIFAGFAGKKYLSHDDLDNLEEILIQADLGWEVVDKILISLSDKHQIEMSWEDRFIETMQLALKDTISIIPLNKIIILIGINGTGKTTTAAKLAGEFSCKGEDVMLVAADTYRAAAVEQIREWSERLNINLVSNTGSKDPAAIAFDGVNSGLSKSMDRIIVDTAGRLHNSPNLMKELEKINRVVRKLTDDVSVLKWYSTSYRIWQIYTH